MQCYHNGKILGHPAREAKADPQVETAVDAIKADYLSEILGYEGEEIMLNPIFQFEDAGEGSGIVQGRLAQVSRLVRIQKLQLAGCMGEYLKLACAHPADRRKTE